MYTFFVFDIEVRILRFSDYFPGSNEKRRKTEIERRKVKKRYENDKKYFDLVNPLLCLINVWLPSSSRNSFSLDI